MAMNTRTPRRIKIYAKEAVSDIDTMFFCQEMKENYATHFLKAAHKEFSELTSKGIFN